MSGAYVYDDAKVTDGGAANTVLVALTVYGDANGDQFTDNADFALWRNNFGKGDHWSQGDFNYDQFTDNADFAIWRNNFGNMPNFGSAAKTAAKTATAAAADTSE